tara:strand:+ start:43 stop:462 length:420 start_codon:yes stop_codon:yes gene_type:complete
MSKQLTIKVTDKQHDLLRRIAISDRYKLDDLVCLVFAKGLEFQWCEDEVSFKKRDDEYTPEEQDQILKNKKIEEELKKENKTIWDIPHEKRKKKGYKSLSTYHRVGGYGDKDDVAHLIAEQLREPMIDKETGNYTWEVV